LGDKDSGRRKAKAQPPRCKLNRFEWTPLEPGVYLHVSDTNVTEVLVVGVVNADMQTANLIWVY
jgi:hypothetical protein